MSFRALTRLSFLTLMLLTTAVTGRLLAQEPPVPHPPPTKWPETVVVTVGDVRTRIEGAKQWTLSGLEWQGVSMATEDSAYGTVLVIRDVGLLGTAHFLDVPDKPGEVEKEQVTHLRFFIDERPISELSPTLNLAGQHFRLERRSNMRGLELETSIILSDGALVETAHFRAITALDLRVTYPWMYAFAPEAKRFVVGDQNGVRQRGEFRSQGKAESQVVQQADWAAVFDPANGRGSVCCYLRRPPQTDSALLLVDAPGSYRKIAGYCLVDTIVPAGFDGVFQAAVGFFAAQEDDWETQAMRRAAEVRQSPAARGAAATPTDD